MVPRSINLADNSEARFFVKHLLVCILMNGCSEGGGNRTKILNKTQWQHNSCNYYSILNLDHVNVAYSAANIVAHATFKR